MTDFVALSRAARDLPGPETHDRLWSTWFGLPQWHFIRVPSPHGWLPYAGYVNGMRCMLGFTEAVRADGYARFASLVMQGVTSPVLSMTPEAAVAQVPQWRMAGIAGMIVDTGPDGFYAQLDLLFGMYQKYRGAARRAPAPAAGPMTWAPAPGRPLSIDTMLALPTWHVITTKNDPAFPELAFKGTDLVAQIFSSASAVQRFFGEGPPPTTAVMTPKDALSLFSDIELVALVRFDNQLEVNFVDLKLRAG